jgi:ribonucleoside-diphosphate reductase alpha chain
VGKYEDGSPGEIFVMMSKQGSTISGLMDSFATAISYALQYGVPLRFLVDKFSHMRFEPSGFTKNPQIPYAKSIVDYLFRWLASKFLDEEARREVGVVAPEAHAAATPAIVAAAAGGIGEAAEAHVEKAAAVMTAAGGEQARMRQAFINQADAPPCPDCGCLMVRNGTCYKCLNCGATSGCS